MNILAICEICRRTLPDDLGEWDKGHFTCCQCLDKRKSESEEEE